MSSPKVEAKEFYQHVRESEPLIADVGTEITYYATNGISTATTIYLNIPDNKGGNKNITELLIRTSATIQMTSYNGEAVSPDFMTITTAGFKDEHCNIAGFKIITTTANTQLFVTAR